MLYGAEYDYCMANNPTKNISIVVQFSPSDNGIRNIFVNSRIERDNLVMPAVFNLLGF